MARKDVVTEGIREDVDYKLGPAVGRCHLPLQGLGRVLLQLLTFNTPWKEFRVKSRNEAVCAPGKLVGQVFQQLDIIRRWFYEPNSSISSNLEQH